MRLAFLEAQKSVCSGGITAEHMMNCLGREFPGSDTICFSLITDQHLL